MNVRLPKTQGIGNIQQLAQQAQKAQEDMQKATEELEIKEYSATSGGGAVEATVSGKLDLLKLNIKPEIIDPEDAEMLADMVIAAVNEAMKKANEEKEEVMSGITGQMNLPNIPGFGGLF